MTRRTMWMRLAAAAAGLRGLFAGGPAQAAAPAAAREVVHTEAEWKALLTPAQFDVLRKAGTERPFSSPLDKEKRAGMFHCAGCRQRAVLVDGQVRQRHRLAQLLPAAGQGGGRRADRSHPGHDAHRGAVPPLRRASGPRVQRRPAAHGPALLHERTGAGVHAGCRMKGIAMSTRTTVVGTLAVALAAWGHPGQRDRRRKTR